MHCGLRGEFPGWTASFGQKPQARGLALWGSFGEGKGNCFDWPSCYSSFESTGLFSWILFNRSWVLISNTHSPEAADSFLTASERQRTQCFSAFQTHTRYLSICLFLQVLPSHFNSLRKQPEWKRQKFKEKAEM